MPVLTHTHQYIRHGGVQSKIFKCAHPDCSHREKKEFIKGKTSVCNKCLEGFILDYQALRRSKPICLNCMDSRAGREHRRIKSGIAELFPEELTK